MSVCVSVYDVGVYVGVCAWYVCVWYVGVCMVCVCVIWVCVWVRVWVCVYGVCMYLCGVCVCVCELLRTDVCLTLQLSVTLGWFPAPQHLSLL